MGVGLIGIIDRPILAKNAADYLEKKILTETEA